MVYCQSCGTGFPLAYPSFRSKVAQTEDGKIVAACDIKKGEVIEKCPLLEWGATRDWKLYNKSGQPVIPLGLVLRYGKEAEGNIRIEIKTHFLFTYATKDIQKNNPIYLPENTDGNAPSN